MADLLTFHKPMPPGTLRDGAFVVSMPRTMWIRPTLAGVMEEALLNLHPVMHYVLNRRNGL
jgi:hypothetical protein